MLTVKDIRKAVCDHFQLQPKQIDGGSRLQTVAFARQAAIALTCEFFAGRMNHENISKEFNCCRSNITHACNRVKALCSYDNKCKTDYEAIQVKLYCQFAEVET